MSLKLIYNNEIKKTAFPKDYDSLCAYVKKAFPSVLAENNDSAFKFFYVDSDGDLISVTQDDDLLQFKESGAADKPGEAMKLHIFSKQSEARNFFDRQHSDYAESFRNS